MIQKEFTCIGCPMGCTLVVKLEAWEILEISGYSCKIGEEHARKECTNPTRIVTTTIPVINGIYPRVSIKTSEQIAKNKVGECMVALKDIKVQAPVNIGDIIYENIVDTGVNVVATQNILKKQH